MKKRILSLLLISVITTVMITGCTNYETGTEKVYSHDEAVTTSKLTLKIQLWIFTTTVPQIKL